MVERNRLVRPALCATCVRHLVGDVAADHAGLAEAFQSEHATLYDLEHAEIRIRSGKTARTSPIAGRSDDPFEVERVGSGAEGLGHREVVGRQIAH
jgi:hypothetical protein